MTRRSLMVAGAFALGLALAYMTCARQVGTPAGDAIRWYTSFPEALSAAQAARKPMVVDFFAVWCGPCKMLAELSFPNQRVQALKDSFVWARIDVDKYPDVAQQYKVRPIPTVLVLDSSGKTVDGFVGFSDGDKVAAFLQQALAKAGGTPPASPAPAAP